MPTLVRSVRKVVLFVLVMAVSGVGVAQAQTDPDIAPPSAEAAGDVVAIDGAAEGITPDIVRYSSRIYATAEQVRPASTSGGAEYMFSKTLVYSDSRVDHYTEWAFYKINGDETNFFVDTVSIAQGKDVSTEPSDKYKVEEFSTTLERPSNASSNPIFKQWATPGGRIMDEPATFSLTYEGASISKTLPALHETLITVSTRSAMPDEPEFFRVTLRVKYMGDRDDAEYPEVFIGGYLSRWEGGPPWGMEVRFSGRAYSRAGGGFHYWNNAQPIEE